MSTNELDGFDVLSDYDPSKDSDFVFESSEGSEREDEDDEDMEMCVQGRNADEAEEEDNDVDSNEVTEVERSARESTTPSQSCDVQLKRSSLRKVKLIGKGTVLTSRS